MRPAQIDDVEQLHDALSRLATATGLSEATPPPDEVAAKVIGNGTVAAVAAAATVIPGIPSSVKTALMFGKVAIDVLPADQSAKLVALITSYAGNLATAIDGYLARRAQPALGDLGGDPLRSQGRRRRRAEQPRARGDLGGDPLRSQGVHLGRHRMHWVPLLATAATVVGGILAAAANLSTIRGTPNRAAPSTAAAPRHDVDAAASRSPSVAGHLGPVLDDTLPAPRVPASYASEPLPSTGAGEDRARAIVLGAQAREWVAEMDDLKQRATDLERQLAACRWDSTAKCYISNRLMTRAEVEEELAELRLRRAKLASQIELAGDLRADTSLRRTSP